MFSINAAAMGFAPVANLGATMQHAAAAIQVNPEAERHLALAERPAYFLACLLALLRRSEGSHSPLQRAAATMRPQSPVRQPGAAPTANACFIL